MDEMDRAQVAEAQFQAGALSKARAPRNEAPLEVDGVRVCRDCEEPLNRARLSAMPNAVRCAPCQSLAERGR